MARIFISHSGHDNIEATALHDWLKGEGYESVFLAIHPLSGFPARAKWQKGLYRELRLCQAVLVVATRSWLASVWCQAEPIIAIERGKKIFVVKVEPLEGPVVTHAHQEIDLTKDRAGGLIKLKRGLIQEGLDPRDSFDFKPGRSIYPGLDAFGTLDAAIFFGRRQESHNAVEMLRSMRQQPPGDAKLLLIVGASGSGKSSLMRAGVIPKLRKEAEAWIALEPIKAGLDAIESLAEALFNCLPADDSRPDFETLLTTLRGSGAVAELLSVAKKIRAAQGHPGATVVISVDQSEDFLVSGVVGGAALLALLRESLLQSDERLMALATLRSDQLETWQKHAEIAIAKEHGALPYRLFPLDPFPMDRISDVVRGPAALIDLAVGDDLVDLLKEDTKTADALPLLAYALRELHETPPGLTKDHYVTLDRLEGVIRNRANDAIDVGNLSDADENALQVAFVPGLVRTTVDGREIRVASRRDAIGDRAGVLIDRLVARRLLTSREDRHGKAIVEIAHEALWRAWPLLSGWITKDRKKLADFATLQQAAGTWMARDRSVDFLDHRDQRLRDIEDLISEQRFLEQLTPNDKGYLSACRDRQSAQEKEKAHRILQANRRRRAQVWGASAAALVLLAVAGYMYLLRQEAEASRVDADAGRAAAVAALKQANRANAQRLAQVATGETDSKKGLQIALRAACLLGDDLSTMQPDSLVYQALYRSARDFNHDLGRAVNFGSPLETIAWSKRERLAATSGDWLWVIDGYDGAPERPVPQPIQAGDRIGSMDWNSDGSVLAVSADRLGIFMYDDATADMQKTTGFPADLSDQVVAWSPTGRRLAVGGKGTGPYRDQIGFFQLRPAGGDGSTWEAALLPPGFFGLGGSGPIPDQVVSIDWSTNAYVAVGLVSGFARIVNASSGQPNITQSFNADFCGESRCHGMPVRLSPDRDHLAIGSANGNAYIEKTVINTRGADERFVLPAAGEDSTDMRAITDLAWSKDGRYLATATGSGTVRIWDWKNRQYIAEFSLTEDGKGGGGGGQTSIVWDPGSGQRMATASRDGVLRFWTWKNIDPPDVLLNFSETYWREKIVGTPQELTEQQLAGLGVTRPLTALPCKD